MMTAVSDQQRKRIHPYKFTLLVAMASILMMFAGFTSAYIVKRADSNWLEFSLPPVFWYSTIVILLSSLTLYLAGKAYRARSMQQYKVLITITAILGLLFMGLQWSGFIFMQQHGVQIIGANSNPSGSFLGIITGVHMLHVLGGVVVLIILLYKAYNRKVIHYDTVSLEVTSTYWHFVDAIWLYLFIFFNIVSG